MLLRHFLPILLGAVLLQLSPRPAEALQADQLLLITNADTPEGRELAELYAEKRGLPDGRILEIAMPTGEAISAKAYWEQVQPAVRAYLREQDLEEQVTCLVTFYGVPLRIGERRLNAAAREEVQAIHRQRDAAAKRVQETIAALEQTASQISSDFQPAIPEENGLSALAKRADAAMRAIDVAAPALDPEQQQTVRRQAMQAMEILSGSAAIAERLTLPPDADPDSPQARKLAELKQSTQAAQQQIAQLQARQQDSEARAQLRELAARHFGMLNLAGILEAQLKIIDAEQTSASVDSELALLWWDEYPRSRWIPNPMHHEINATGAPRTLMVSRIDAPTPDIARQLILDSLQAETNGLAGNFAIDIGGSLTLGAKGKVRDQYTVWDDHLRSLARLIGEHTDFKLIMDQAAGVFSPGSVADCALYCGWYSLRNYVPAFEFNTGAVAWHIASFELKALRDPEEKGWVAGLLRDGVVATIGAVDEPYLHAFPQPDVFFPLLMTGRLTLAEVYWTTAPLMSWKMVLIGDPLYRPFASGAAFEVEQLSPTLRQHIEDDSLKNSND